MSASVCLILPARSTHTRRCWKGLEEWALLAAEQGQQGKAAGLLLLLVMAAASCDAESYS